MSTNHDANLIRMANQIGIFFESMPDREEACAGIVNHLKKFWDPRMRQAFLAQLDGAEATEIRPIVRDAVQAHRGQLM